MKKENISERQQIEKTVSKSRKQRQKLEFASLKLEELIVQLEKENRLQRSQHLSKVCSN